MCILTGHTYGRGKRTGFFTSPHLVSVNERIRVDNIQIDNETFLKVFRKVLKIVRQMVEDGIEHPSYFEFLFGMGMTAFAETDVEYIILETGLGGRLDATNAIDNPALAVITSISLDHTAILGDTIEKIAGEKAGIIKPGVPVFFDGSSKKAAEVIKAKASELGVSCREVTKNAYEIQEVHRKYIAFSRRSAYVKMLSSGTDVRMLPGDECRACTGGVGISACGRRDTYGPVEGSTCRTSLGRKNGTGRSTYYRRRCT